MTNPKLRRTKRKKKRNNKKCGMIKFKRYGTKSKDGKMREHGREK